MASWKAILQGLALCLLFAFATSKELEAHINQTNNPLVGLIGFGIEMYKPLCAAACHDILSRVELDCSIPNPEKSRGFDRLTPAAGRPVQPFLTPAWCLATDVSYLTSLAYCVDQHCGKSGDNEPIWELERFWSSNAANGVMEPSWSYMESLHQAHDILGNDTPKTWRSGLMNYTAATNQTRYKSVYGSFGTYEHAEVMHSRYGLITLVVGAGIPILLTLVNYLPWGTTLSNKLAPYLDMSIFKGYHVRILPYWLGNATTLGQALYILSFFILNVVVSAVDYQTYTPHRMYNSTYIELMYYVANRTGLIAFAIVPLVVLLASRNNILLWLTNWSHGTFIILHRWVGRVFIIQCIVHSIAELHLFRYRGRYPAEEKKPYWQWGIVATVAAVTILFVGITWMRRKHYEIFLITHILLVILLLIGSWYHVQLLYFGTRGYENWLYACFAVWAADRLLRLLWVAKTGVKNSTVTELSNDLVRIDIEGVRWEHRPGAHAYAYFPTLSWRVWENHPFSVVPTALIRRSQQGSITDGEKTPDSSSTSEGSNPVQIEKGIDVTGHKVGTMKGITTTTGVTLYIKRSKGMTGMLKSNQKLTTLLEGPYKDRSHKNLELCDRLVCLAGGVGITGVIESAASHLNSKLYWSMKENDAPLAQDLESVTSHLGEAEVRVGQRFNVREILELESEGGYKRIGVVVCGPEALCDDVRAIVTRMGRHTSAISYQLAVEAFSW